MTLSFVSPKSSKPIGSIDLARNVLNAATANLPNAQEFRASLKSMRSYRDEYQKLFSDLGQIEFSSQKDLLNIAQNGLAALATSVVNRVGQNLTQLTELGWSSQEQLVITVAIQGKRDTTTLSSAAITASWVDQKLAEPGLYAAAAFLKLQPEIHPASGDLLVALGAAAEFAPTENWLKLGGSVAAVARPRKALWQQLIETARQSGGELLVPVLASRLRAKGLTADASLAARMNDEQLAEFAGLDLIEDVSAIASWLAELSAPNLGSKEGHRTVLGCYAYAPAAEHIRVQAVQDSLIARLIENRAAEKIALAWLATPTDSTVVTSDVAESNLERFQHRSLLTRFRDKFFEPLGQLKPATLNKFSSSDGTELATIDSSIKLQGPSYLFAKRTQRWRAYLAHSQGVLVSYQICPPARTDSVLSRRILTASYAGGPKVGLHPFEIQTANLAATAMLLRDLYDADAPANPKRKLANPVELHAANAIHGGFWRLAYEPSTIGIASTLMGLPSVLTTKN